MYRLLEASLAAKLLDQLQRRAHGVERRDFQYLDVVEIGDRAFVLVLVEQSLQDGTGLRAVLVNTSRFLTWLARSRRLSGGWSKAM